MMLQAVLLAIVFTAAAGQRITTIQLDGVQYFISRMNPYSPELNYYLAYQYCRSIGLQLASFETKEKADSITQYLSNAGYNKYDFWTSGNKLGTDMLIWMSTGLPFNATFDYMRKEPGEDVPVARQLGAVEQRKDSGAANGCVALKTPDLQWSTDDCTDIKDFICEQTRCYYYNYGSIPVSTAQGSRSTGRSSSSSSFNSFTSSPTSSTSTTTTAAATTTTTTTSEPTTTRTIETTGNPLDNNITLDSSATEDLADGFASTEAISSTPPRVHLRNKPHDKSMKDTQENIPWSWARNIELEKPVLKKPANL